MKNRTVAILLALVLAAFAGALGYQRYREQYLEERRENETLAGVVTAAFSGRNDLRVGTISGTVQSKATDPGRFAFLDAEQVIKAPYSVDYFVDLGQLSLDDYQWDRERRTLTIRIPPVKVGRANIDEGRRTLVRTSGLYVSRGAGERLSRQVSAHAQALVQTKAEEPAQVARARERARQAVPRLIKPALTVAGLADVRVVAVFADEAARPDNERWDVTRSLQEVLADPRYD